MDKHPFETLKENLMKEYIKEITYLKDNNKLHYFNENDSYDFILLARMREYGCEEYIKLLEQ